MLCYERSVAVGKRREEGNLKKSAAVKAERGSLKSGRRARLFRDRAGEHLMHTHETRRADGEEQLNGKLRLAQRSPKLLLARCHILSHPILSALFTLAQHLVKHSRREKECGTGERADADGPAQVRYQLSDEIIAASSLTASTVATL